MTVDEKPLERLSLKEAAVWLGITEAGVRARYRRDALKGEKDENGKLWVFIDRTATGRPAVQEETVESLIDRVDCRSAVDDGRASEAERDDFTGALSLIIARLDRIEATLASAPAPQTARVAAMTDERDELLFRINALESLLDIAMRDHSGRLTELAARMESRRPALSYLWDWLHGRFATTAAR